MGAGIARAVAGTGLEVYVCEKDEVSAAGVRRELEAALDREIRRWALTASEKRALLGRIEAGTEVSRAKEASLVIESVTEDLEVKREVFRRLDGVCPPQTIFVTNTATLSVSELAQATQRPERVVGLHFVYPASTTRVAEVIRGLATSDETVQTIKEFARRLGKTPIEVFESPGYVTTRVIVPLINEATYVVLEGVASAEDVDQAMKLGYGFEKGPLALADSMGLDVVMSWMEHLFHELGETKYRPCPLLRKMVRAGRLGVKTGKGFFDYE